MTRRQLSLFNEDGPFGPPSAQELHQDKQIDPFSAFEEWLDSCRPAFRPSSKTVYRSLWAKFIRYTREQGIPFFRIEPNDITLFLADLPIKRPQRERYLKVIGRAFDELTHLVPDLTSPVNTQVQDPYRRTWRAAPGNDPKKFITHEDQATLLLAIKKEYTILQTLTKPFRFTEWKRFRDLAVLTLLYGCGVKASEAVFLSVNCISEAPSGQWELDVGQYEGITKAERLAGRHNPHEDATHAWHSADAGIHRKIPIPNWAVGILRDWQQLCASDQIRVQAPSWRLFATSRQVGSRRVNSSMDMATLNRIVRAWGKNTPISF